MKKFRKPLREITLTIFFIMMFLCAGLALATFWIDGMENVVFNNTPVVPTFFIIGLASFLIWIVIVIQDVYEKYTGNKE